MPSDDFAAFAGALGLLRVQAAGEQQGGPAAFARRDAVRSARGRVGGRDLVGLFVEQAREDHASRSASVRPARSARRDLGSPPPAAADASGSRARSAPPAAGPRADRLARPLSGTSFSRAFSVGRLDAQRIEVVARATARTPACPRRSPARPMPQPRSTSSPAPPLAGAARRAAGPGTAAWSGASRCRTPGRGRARFPSPAPNRRRLSSRPQRLPRRPQQHDPRTSSPISTEP